MIRTDGRPTICSPSIFLPKAEVDPAATRNCDGFPGLLDRSFRPGGRTVREMVDGLGRGTRCACGDPGDCHDCTPEDGSWK